MNKYLSGDYILASINYYTKEILKPVKILSITNSNSYGYNYTIQCLDDNRIFCIASHRIISSYSTELVKILRLLYE